MSDYKYLIIGGGMTADAAVQGIREIDSAGSIGIISNEPNPPYNRPPLSKALWKGEPLDIVWRETSKDKAELHLSVTAKSIDSKTKRVMDDRGVSHGYDKLLLATGGTVRRLPWNVDGISYYRTLDDYRNLRALADQKESFAVIGGGFIGSEMAAALTMAGKSVTMIFPESGIGTRIYPPRLSTFLNRYFESKGVKLLANDGVGDLVKQGSNYRLTTTGFDEYVFDGVVAGIGIQPNVDLARAAGLKIDNGIIVDEFLQTSQPDIFAAGDVANFASPALGKRMRVEHEDNANTGGKTAGANMAGAQTKYHHLPFFYSDLFDLGYEAVGELDPRLDVVEDWQEEFRTGVVYYLKDKRVRGVLLWNVWGQVDTARQLISDSGPFDAGNLKGRIKAS